MIRPKKFIITSQYHPKELFTDEKALEAITRRFKIRNICALDMDDSQIITRKSNRPTKVLPPMPNTLKRTLDEMPKKKHDKIVMAAKKPRLFKQNASGLLVPSTPTIRDLSFPTKTSQDIPDGTTGRNGCVEEVIISDDENDCDKYNDSDELEDDDGSSDYDSFSDSADSESDSDSDFDH